MNRLCRWGMHLPGPHKLFHRGRLFTRCEDCGETLIVVGRRWRTVPRGKRVAWRARMPADLFAEISPNLHRARLRPDLRRLFGSAG